MPSWKYYILHLPFLNFIFDDRHYDLAACQKSFELPWHELLSPVLLNINHYHRCLFFWLVFELLPGVNNLIWALFKPDFPAVIWRKKWKCFIFWREQKGMDCVLVLFWRNFCRIQMTDHDIRTVFSRAKIQNCNMHGAQWYFHEWYDSGTYLQ